MNSIRLTRWFAVGSCVVGVLAMFEAVRQAWFVLGLFSNVLLRDGELHNVSLVLPSITRTLLTPLAFSGGGLALWLLAGIAEAVGRGAAGRPR